MELVSKLKNDREILESKAPGLISDACLKRPPLSSQEYKQLALQLYDADVTPSVTERKWAYIRFARLLRDLKKLYHLQHPVLKPPHKALACARFPDHKLARLHGNDDIYHKLLDLPLQEPITNPSAMPVDIAQENELEPFFQHLQSNVPAHPIHSDKNGDYISFQRGAHYTDGRIDLCKQVVGPDHIRTLMKSIRGNPHVEHFLLGNNIIGLVGGEAIGTFLSTHHRQSRIKTWYLAGNSLDAESI